MPSWLVNMVDFVRHAMLICNMINYVTGKIWRFVVCRNNIPVHVSNWSKLEILST